MNRCAYWPGSSRIAQFFCISLKHVVGFVILCRSLLWNQGSLFEILSCHWLNFTSPLAVFDTKNTLCAFQTLVTFQLGSVIRSIFPKPNTSALENLPKHHHNCHLSFSKYLSVFYAVSLHEFTSILEASFLQTWSL